ncbi:MAG TPA: DUF4097 family beta strand repeat-containing protein [Longimicrobium sp.]|nr:DUF4097 family beta strand repeat-containing protein [Longimicrobium sp.]
MRRLLAGTTIVAVAAVAALAPRTATAQERHTLEGDRVAVYNLAGEMNVEPGTGRDVTVLVTRGGADAGSLAIRRGESEGGRTLAVVYPGDRVVYPELGRGTTTDLEVRPDGTFGGGGVGRLLGGGRSRRVRVGGSGSGTRAWADVRVQVPAGRTVTVHLAAGRVDVANVNGDLRVRSHAAPIRASGTRGSLDLDTGSGGVEVRDAQGELRVDTGSGGVRVANVSGGLLHVDTGSGGVAGEGVRVQRLHVDVGSGGVRLSGVDARDVNIDSGSGAVNLRLAGDAESVRVDTGSGGVVLAVPSQFGAQAEIDTGSGGVHVDVPAEVTRRNRTHFSGRIGDGRGRLMIDTGSGGVRVIGS